jgi:hypothetical protein
MPLLMTGGIVLFLGAFAFPADAEVRTVTVKLVADEEFRAAGRAWPGEWTHEVRRMVSSVSGEFEERFGIRFAIAGVGVWMSDNGRHSVQNLLGDLYPDARKSKAQILIGFTAQGTISDRFAGGTSFEHRVVLIRRTWPESAMRDILRHELCHIFGAIDIREPGSVMDIVDSVRGDGFDAFTAGMVLLHKDREFGRGAGLRPGPDMDAALALCLERHEAKPAEIPVLDRMAHYYHAQKDYAALKRVAADALSRNPELSEFHNFLGIACSIFGEDARATQEFEEAVRLRPAFPEACLNLALCRLKAGEDARAEECCRMALKVLPGDYEAHKLLGQILERRNRPVEAVSHYRIAIRIDPRLGEELTARVKKLS